MTAVHTPLRAVDLPPGLSEHLVVRPGDTLVFRCEYNIAKEEAEAFKAELESHLPGVTVKVVIARGMVVYRPLESAAS